MAPYCLAKAKRRFFLLEDLKNATTPTILPGVSGGMLREVTAQRNCTSIHFLIADH